MLFSKKIKFVVFYFIVKTGGFDHSSPEGIQLIKQPVNNNLTIDLWDQNIPADTGQSHRFFRLKNCPVFCCRFSFSQIFRKVPGMSPAMYRNRKS
jgi:hypothetical protein